MIRHRRPHFFTEVQGWGFLSKRCGVSPKSFDHAGSLTGTVFHSQSTFVTDNLTVTDSTLPLASQTEHIDNVHTTPFRFMAIYLRDDGVLIMLRGMPRQQGFYRRHSGDAQG
jgi:hypothetical protein